MLDYMDLNFPVSWKTKNAQSAFYYWVLGDYSKGLELAVQVLYENPEDVQANFVAAMVYKRRLNLSKALNHITKCIKQFPAELSYWGELGNMLRTNGDKINQFKVLDRIVRANPKIFIEYYDFLYYENRLGELSESVKTSVRNKYNADVYFLKRDYYELLKYLDKIPSDSTLLSLNKDSYRATVYYLLNKDDSSKLFAARFLKSPESKKDRFLPARMKSILNDEKGAIENVEAIYGPAIDESGDLLLQWYRRRYMLTAYVFSRNYAEATNQLVKMNKEFPQVGNYNWLNSPIFDRIKKEHLPFVEAINSIKYPEKIMDGKSMKW